MFYASYPESELIRDNERKFKTANEFLTMNKKTVIRETSSYKQGDQYMSPLHDMLSLYNTVDVSSELTIHITLQFKKEKTILDHMIHISKTIF